MRRFWTLEERRVLREIYPETPNREIAARLNRSVSAINRQAAASNPPLRKTLQFKRTYGFQPGSEVGAPSQFKKGQRSANWLPVGTLQPTTDGYLRMKVRSKSLGCGGSDLAWMFVHKMVWEQAHGPIRPGYRLWWKDGNRMNCALENLELLSPRRHMARTTIHNLPEELKLTIRVTARLTRRIHKLEQMYGKK